ncbi:uncharacterized protein LOC129596204 isoform X2 [Paramacrobiotus metropolitanus]|uniref:uncharacterized protein LOC129596204 isoform X2 n=1 Tax=Paramacrobiotus metropolitanus TaxID=2943436 RepID=UPI002445B896|nr:uncharacterized protein LOC129596204 isoform X2 [Paramacrobiotus metropolitanus]
MFNLFFFKKDGWFSGRLKARSARRLEEVRGLRPTKNNFIGKPPSGKGIRITATRYFFHKESPNHLRGKITRSTVNRDHSHDADGPTSTGSLAELIMNAPRMDAVRRKMKFS